MRGGGDAGGARGTGSLFGEGARRTGSWGRAVRQTEQVVGAVARGTGFGGRGGEGLSRKQQKTKWKEKKNKIV